MHSSSLFESFFCRLIFSKACHMKQAFQYSLQVQGTILFIQYITGHTKNKGILIKSWEFQWQMFGIIRSNGLSQKRKVRLFSLSATAMQLLDCRLPYEDTKPILKNINRCGRGHVNVHATSNGLRSCGWGGSWVERHGNEKSWILRTLSPWINNCSENWSSRPRYGTNCRNHEESCCK